MVLEFAFELVVSISFGSRCEISVVRRLRGRVYPGCRHVRAAVCVVQFDLIWLKVAHRTSVIHRYSYGIILFELHVDSNLQAMTVIQSCPQFVDFLLYALVSLLHTHIGYAE